MCTVTFVPGTQGYLLCSNRDERISRAQTLPPALYEEDGIRRYYPRDLESTGSWIACTPTGLSYCLLNGAFEAHLPQPPYRKSRGIILLEILRSGSAEKFLETSNLEGIEPFTLVMINETLPSLLLQELRWDGHQIWLKTLDSQSPWIWSSSPLYSAAVRQQRERWFQTWLQQHPQPTREDLLRFHRFGGEGNGENDLVMSRQNDRQTISITAVSKMAGSKNMLYRDLISGQDYEVEII